MKINNNILVGVPYPKLVSLYGTLVHYACQLEITKPELKSHELIGLVVCSPDNGQTVLEYYYTIFNNETFVTVSNSNKEKNTAVWENPKLTDKATMFENIRKQIHILDLEYYLNNN